MNERKYLDENGVKHLVEEIVDNMKATISIGKIDLQVVVLINQDIEWEVTDYFVDNTKLPMNGGKVKLTVKLAPKENIEEEE